MTILYTSAVVRVTSRHNVPQVVSKTSAVSPYLVLSSHLASSLRQRLPQLAEETLGQSGAARNVTREALIDLLYSDLL